MKSRTRALMLLVTLAAAGCAAESDAPAQGAAEPLAGYTLFHPLTSTSIYLVDLEGELVHQWRTEYNTGQCVYLLDNGNLLRCARDPEVTGPYRGGGEGGIVQEIAPDGTVVWEFEFSDETKRHHHDVEKMPNGNVLLIAWEGRTRGEAIQAGINPDRFEGDQIWPDFVVEIEPVYPNGGNVVWEWHAWDHLVQELYEDKDSYDLVSRNPQLIDINAAAAHRERQESAEPENVERLRALGYIAGNADTDDRPEISSDWLHSNGVDYNAELDQILLSVRHFSEIWVIDHSTTTEEAAGHTGGRCGRGGDLLYRWGNPEAHGAGTPEDRKLFVQHDAQWIPEGFPGAGNITVFNNGSGRAEEPWTTADEIVPPLNPDGTYVMERSVPTLPEAPVWSWAHPDPTSVYASNLGGVQRLSNGNTLIGLGVGGRMIEVGADDQIVWDWTNPYIESEGPQELQRLRREEQRQLEEAEARAAAEAAGEEPEAESEPSPARRGGPRTPGSTYRGWRLAPDHPGLMIVLAAANGGLPPVIQEDATEQ
ncbi:MAG: hypothetical protein GKS06_19995 [Acidobacteria bacterium]|nr:hypothetical protein [Acidobacteriota bacterium]